MSAVPRSIVLLLIAATLAPWPSHVIAGSVYAPPQDSPDTTNEVKGIERELADGNYPVAAKRLDLLLAQRGENLMAVADGTLRSVAAWCDQLPAETRKALTVEYEKAAGQNARARLEGLGEAARPDELYTVARRFPMTNAAAAALVRAGDRSAQLGDLPAAQAYYELAIRDGAALGEAQDKRLNALREMNGGRILPAPPDLTDVHVATAKPQAGFNGALPFDATWYGNPAAAGYAKYLPAVYDHRVILASWKNVIALRDDGQRLWDTPNPRLPHVYAADRSLAFGRGALFAPAVLSDVYGRPVTIVVRQPGPQGETQFALRALDAADGKLLWSTDAGPSPDELTYSGLPTVSGRYVYGVAVAAKEDEPDGQLVLAALDVATGQSLWRTTLGAVVEQGDEEFGHKFSRGEPLALGAFAHLAEPCVSGDLVIVSPNCGAVIAVGRFDGKIRWVCVYREPVAANPRQQGRNRSRRPPAAVAAGEVDRGLLARYKATPVVCGNVVAALPQDSPALLGIDRVTGKLLWSSDATIRDAYALAGASGDIVVASGASIAGIDVGNRGILKWRFSPARGVQLTGPACVVGQTVIAPTSAGIMQLSVTDGTQVQVYDISAARRLLETEGGRSAIAEAGANRTFGTPPPVR